jgi:hypothetical protein
VPTRCELAWRLARWPLYARAASRQLYRQRERTMDAILIINAGSSSVKFQVFEVQGKAGLKRLVKSI